MTDRTDLADEVERIVPRSDQFLTRDNDTLREAARLLREPHPDTVRLDWLGHCATVDRLYAEKLEDRLHRMSEDWHDATCRVEVLEADRNRYKMKADQYAEQLEDGFAALIEEWNKAKTIARQRIEVLEAALRHVIDNSASQGWDEAVKRARALLTTEASDG